MSTVTLNRNCDFRRLYYKGRSYTNPALVVYLKKSGAGICRIGITVSKKIGSAVERNRCKRIIRAAWKNVEKEISGSWDIVFVARGKTKYLKSTDIEKAMLEIFRQAGAVNEKSNTEDN